MFNPLDLSGRQFLISGAASGIGKATALLLSELGARLLLLDINEEMLIKTKEKCKPTDDYMILDLKDTNQIKSSIKDKILSFGKLNGFVHCAGIPYIAPLNVINNEKAEMVFKINTLAAIELAKICSNKQVFAGEHGSFVLISSVYGLVGASANVVYAMSKAAVIGITKSLSIELAPKGIRVNCIAPGFVKTTMMDDNTGKFNDTYFETLSKLHPLGLGEAEAVAEPVAFLL
ncbi:MAG: SDR family oxidoreductase [Bacteroidales bacterium]